MRIVLSFFPAVMMPRRRAGWRLSQRAMGAWTFTRLEAGVHQAPLKCFIGCSALGAFRGFFLARVSITGLDHLLAAIERV